MQTIDHQIKVEITVIMQIVGAPTSVRVDTTLTHNGGTAELAPALKLMFSQFLNHCLIPASLKRAAITPVFRSGIKTSKVITYQYHLVLQLLKYLRRLLEQVVAFLTRQVHLNNTQHGFRCGRSCLSALLCIFDDLIHMPSSDSRARKRSTIFTCQ